jgi:hypothetical protein
MRFTLADWLRLILACIAAAAAIAVVCVLSFAAMGVPDTTPVLLYGAAERAERAMRILAIANLVLGVLYVPLSVLAAWPVLRSRVDGLRFRPWLREAALGAGLAGLVCLPAMLFLLYMPVSASPLANVSVIGWLPAVAAAIAALLPSGLLLQRLGGVRAWPSLIVVAVALTAFPALMSGALVHELVPEVVASAIFLKSILPAAHWLVVVTVGVSLRVVMSGVLTGLILGAGLFLMARLPQPAVTQ